jgi:predicted nucleotidyltransferase component of viral defense system
MVKWLAISDATKKNAYEQIAERTGMSAFAVEKDWWVVQTLSVVFEMEVASHLVFKGGTSLSKAWGLIQRFSEDIDLAIDRGYFGFEGELSKNQRDNLRKTTGRFVEEHFFGEIVQRFEEKGFSGLKFELVEEVESDKDRKININYPNLLKPPGYLLPRVQIEISCRSMREPFTIQTINSLVDESYSETDFAMPPILIPTVNPERTFLEKVFLLHEEFHRPKDKMRVDRLSRHLYDIVKLARTEIADKALDDRVLYQTIVEHRQKFTRVGGVDYNLHQPQTIDPIPIPENIEAWRADYNTMIQQMIYETNPPSFDQMIAEITELRSRINALTWRFETEFPTLII